MPSRSRVRTLPLDELYGSLIGAGGAGALSAFLMWIHVQNTRRLDLMQSKHDQLLSDWKTERVSVMGKLIEETNAINVNLVEAKKTLDGALEKIDTGLTEMRRHYTEQDVKERIKGS